MTTNAEKESIFHLVSYERGSQTICFHPASDSGTGAKVCVIIGPNGSGKSRILGEIADELIRMDELRSKGARERKFRAFDETDLEGASISYRQGNQNCRVQRVGDQLQGWINGIPASPHQLPFPRKLLAVAHLPVDRFRFSTSNPHEFYSYLGLRQATNLTTTGALELKVILALFRGHEQTGFLQHLEPWLALLNIQGPISVKFSVARRELAHLDSYDAFLTHAEEVMQRRVGSARRSSLSDFRNRYAQELDASWLLLRRLVQEPYQSDKRRAIVKIDVTQEGFDDEFPVRIWEQAIESARRLRLLDEISLHFLKDGTEVRFSHLSSGEQQILGTVTRILSNIRTNSIIFIDEPEVSLHPSWQMRYVPTLLQTLQAFPSTHVIIATHSHFLVSDVDPERASLVVAPGDTLGDFDFFDGDVYGRSPENILYRVFGIGVAGNFYVERDLTRALQMVSGQRNPDHTELRLILDRLRRVSAGDNEALAKIVQEISTFLENAQQ